MKNIIRFRFLCLFFLMHLASCSKVSAITPGIGAFTQIPSNTLLLESTLALSHSPTVSLTSTIPPTISPTAGPPPDLELVNPIAYPRYTNTTGDDYYILGRIRNNTDQIMVFYWDDIVFKFTLETWQHFNDVPIVYHSIYIDEAIRGGESSLSMNCILYPGDEGVYYYYSRSNRPQEDYLLYAEELKSYDGALGLSVVAYESFYRTNPEIQPNLHLAIENITYQKVDGDLDFEFDVLQIPQKMSSNSYDPTYIYTWVILYDSQDKIINILFRDIGGIPGIIRGGDFHVHGNTAANYSDKEKYFRSVRKITSDMIESVRRIEVLTEYTEGDMC